MAAEDVEQGRNHCREQIDVLVDGNVISTDFSAPANTVDKLAWPEKHIAFNSSNNVESIYSHCDFKVQ